MDKKVSQSSSSASETINNNSRDDYLRHLNKLSHKISKPTPSSSSSSTPSPAILIKKPPPPPPPHFDAPNPNSNPAPPQHQPPVYNINKSDFRDVVQKLTGSPAHDNINNNRPSSLAGAPANIRSPAAAASSRLHRIRPPPLSHFSRPSSAATAAPPPLSPLPPLPAVHGAAESPVSAYMRYLHTSMASDSALKNQASFPSSSASGFSPRWSNLAPIPPIVAAPGAQFQIPPPPIPFGCLNSPRSPYPLLLSSPSSGQLGFPQLPLSPTVPPMPSPRWRSF